MPEPGQPEPGGASEAGAGLTATGRVGTARRCGSAKQDKSHKSSADPNLAVQLITNKRDNSPGNGVEYSTCFPDLSGHRKAIALPLRAAEDGQRNGGTQGSQGWICQRAGDYAALRAPLAGRVAEDGTGGRAQPPVELSGVLTLVARQAHYAGAEPAYRRYRDKQRSRPKPRSSPSGRTGNRAPCRTNRRWPPALGLLGSPRADGDVMPRLPPSHPSPPHRAR